jgi:GTP-binding protein Era
MKVGYVNILGRPNAGKSTLLNALVGEKMAIVSPKVQTTRHRIKSILNAKDSQIVFSDTPGIIDPRYKLHERMMKAVQESLQDADLLLLLVAIRDNWAENDRLFGTLPLKAPSLIILNKSDEVPPSRIEEASEFFRKRPYVAEVHAISALRNTGIEKLLMRIRSLLPEGEPYFDGDDLTDLPIRFFVQEMIREKIFANAEEEIPYHTTVLVQEFTEKESLTKIRADIIVQRETQKGILLGAEGRMIRKIGTEARKDIESFLGRKVFLDLFIKVKPRWRDNEIYLKEYGY